MAAGSLSHLTRLSAVRSDKNIKFLTPAVYSGGSSGPGRGGAALLHSPVEGQRRIKVLEDDGVGVVTGAP